MQYVYYLYEYPKNQELTGVEKNDFHYIKLGSIELPVLLTIGSEFQWENQHFKVLSVLSDSYIQCFKVDFDYDWHARVDISERKTELHLYTESQVREYVLKALSEHFHIEREVPGHHPSGRTVRIDAVITPKDSTVWGKNSGVSFGVEFKCPQTKSKGSKRGKISYYAQCYDYAHSEFRKYGRIPILVCPRFRIGQELTKFLAEFNVGYIDLLSERIGSNLFISLGSILWCEEKGVHHEGRTRGLNIKVGVRNAKTPHNFQT